MNYQLDGLKIAALVTDNFEEVELTAPRAAFESAGAQVSVVSDKGAKFKACIMT